MSTKLCCFGRGLHSGLAVHRDRILVVNVLILLLLIDVKTPVTVLDRPVPANLPMLIVSIDGQ